MSHTPIIPPNVKLLRHHATSGQIRVIHLYLVRRTLAVAMDRAGVAPVDAAPPLATQWMSTSAPI